MALRETIQSHQTSCSSHRRTAQRQWFEEDWAASKKRTYNFINGSSEQCAGAAPLLTRPDGTVTGNLLEIDTMLHEAWMPTFQLYARTPVPSWDEFEARFHIYFPARVPFEYRLMTVEMIQDTLKRMSNDTSAGVDGWRVRELKALPQLLDLLADLFNLIEQTGTWPDALCTGVISMIPKGDGMSPSKLRPISVMPTLYRLWSATRVGEVLAWQESWAHPNMFGFRHVKGCEDAFWQLSLRVEHALLHDRPICGIGLDFAKAFDRIPQEHVFRLASHMGMPEPILGALRNMYSKLRRHFRIGSFCGAGFHATNGILQGCPLSIVLLNVLIQVWMTAVTVECPGADPFCYADDANAVASSRAQLDSVLGVTADFTRLTNMKLNVPKCAGSLRP